MTGNENKSVALSLCIPTNGIIDWVNPVLESIYRQGVIEEKFEVIVTDNGNDDDFYVMMQNWCQKHSNILYRRTKAQGFLNQIACFREANGEFIKFVNHRMTLLPGALQHILDFVVDNHETRPICYFLNNNLHLPINSTYKDFDGFVRALSYYSSWSGGLGVWREDFLNLPDNQAYNILFPHITILFQTYEKRKYMIDNTFLMKSLPEKHPKGRYNLFHAFAVEYPGIIVDLLRRGEITLVTVLQLKKELLVFLASLYIDYRILGRKCSYDLEGMEESINVYYSRWQLWRKVIFLFIKKVGMKIYYTFARKLFDS